MKVASINENDIADCDDGICVSLWVSGCPHHCPNCHNSELWDYNYGEDIPKETVVEKIIEALTKNGIERNFSVLGGEPLCPANIENVLFVVSKVREAFPDIKIYVWTGYVLEHLQEKYEYRDLVDQILKLIDVLIDGPYVDELRDIRLKLRGSSNQRIIRIVR